MRHSPRGAFPATFTQPEFIFGFGSHPQVSWGVRREVDPFLSSPPSSRCANIFFFRVFLLLSPAHSWIWFLTLMASTASLNSRLPSFSPCTSLPQKNPI